MYTDYLNDLAQTVKKGKPKFHRQYPPPVYHHCTTFRRVKSNTRSSLLTTVSNHNQHGNERINEPEKICLELKHLKCIVLDPEWFQYVTVNTFIYIKINLRLVLSASELSNSNDG
jgi:hypothetical protein